MRTPAFIFVCLLIAIPCRARTITVDDDVTADFNNIQAAINDASDGDIIEVQPGIYTGDGNRDIDFLGKRITVRSIDPGDPDIVAATIIDCNGTELDPHRGFDLSSCERDSLLDGLTITNGYGPNEPTTWWEDKSSGGGIYCLYSDATIRNCVIVGNSAAVGGGIYCGYKPIITNCTIKNNTASGLGGGIYCEYDSGIGPTIAECTIRDNVASYSGGGICYYCDNPTISHCRFEGNRAEGTEGCFDGGGGIYSDGYGTILNCVFTENYSATSGGGFSIGGYAYGQPELVNCTFYKNYANYNGGAVAAQGVGSGKNPKVQNCIVWGNEPNDDSGVAIFPCGKGGFPTVSVDFSILQSNWPGGTGIIISDPCFADAANGDYHLKSQAGRWDPNSQSWVQDTVTSPAIDAGDPLEPVGYEPFPNGGIINMGAYGGTAEASKSYFGEPVCKTIVAGDINGDCKVDFLDFRLMALHWLDCGLDPDASCWQ